ncbi:MAG: hypothetical protein ABSD81_00630 [Methanomicrobiales archaeon]|jgi:hypothetical protein
MPLYIGNWINGGRPFNGKIFEVKITNYSMNAESIAQNWERINRAFM